jgi:hypothetical protein
MTLAPGTRLGPYEIQSLLGAGGMGEVYKARDTRLDRAVANKILPPDVTDPDPSTSSGSSRSRPRDDHRARFEREAETIAGLNHPHICTLHDVGDHDGSLFLVMELPDGESLREQLSRGCAAATVDRAGTGPVAPVRLNPDVPPEPERIVNKLPEKDRALRLLEQGFGTFGEPPLLYVGLAEALARLT